MSTEEKKSYPSKEVRDSLMSRRTVWLYGEITTEVIQDVTERILLLQAQNSDRINLIIESPGGSMDVAFGLCDVMANIVKAPVRGIALRRCGSAATFIMLHCTERAGMPHAMFLIHSGQFGAKHMGDSSLPIGTETVRSGKQLVQQLKRWEKRLHNVYLLRLTPEAWRTKRPSKSKCLAYVVKLLCRGDQRYDTWMTAQKAIKVGLITGIVTEKLDIFPA